MEIFKYGNLNSNNVIIQLVDEHDLSIIENEVKYILDHSHKDFCLLALKVNDWNKDLSPWKAKAVFGNDDFGDGASETLKEVVSLCTDSNKNYFIGGYSLAGLFALWAVYQIGIFKGVNAASPSIWFPDFVTYMKQNKIRSNSIYLSLGDKEDKTRNPVMQTVSNRIKEAYEHLKNEGTKVVLEWNEGNHFKDNDIRTAKGYIYLLNAI